MGERRGCAHNDDVVRGGDWDRGVRGTDLQSTVSGTRSVPPRRNDGYVGRREWVRGVGSTGLQSNVSGTKSMTHRPQTSSGAVC